MRARRAALSATDRGSVSLWVVIFAFVTLYLLVLVVDGGQVIVAKSRAADIAEQAARAAADDLNPDSLRTGDYQLAGDACSVKAKDVVTASGLDASAVTKCVQTGTLTLGGGQVVPVVEVDLTFKYSPILLSLFFSTDFTANAKATAYPQPGF